MFSMTELWTEESMQQFINDELVESQENPLGIIPFVHISNKKVPSSPWGLSDIQDITDLNRQYNETFTLVNDILDYYACVDENTQALTRGGWKSSVDLSVGDEILTLNPNTDEIEWQSITNMFNGVHTGSMVKLSNHIDALVTPNHRWLVEQQKTRNRIYPLGARQFGRTLVGSADEPALEDFRGDSRLVVGGGTPMACADQVKWTDELVETVGWYLTEGCDSYTGPNDWHSVTISQSPSANPQHVASIRRLMKYWRRGGGTFNESTKLTNSGCLVWYLGVGVKEVLEEVAPEKAITPAFISSLTYSQVKLLQKVMIDGDGHRDERRESWYQEDDGRKDGFQMLNALLGIRVNQRGHFVDLYTRRAIEVKSTLKTAEVVGVSNLPIWCPTVSNSVWMARRNGNTYWTGNSPTTVILGAKASNLERGPKKVWAIPNDKARIENLDLGSQGVEGALQFLETLKEKMHEIVGIPVNALGQPQEISNTSGVALSLQYLPLMQVMRQKTTQFSAGLQMFNELIIRAVAVYMPELLSIDPNRDPPLEEGQLTVLDPRDPLTYRNTVEFASPLPIDKLIALNEIEMEMRLGLESKTGALKKLGEMYPAEKLQELMNELHQDALEQGALDLLRSQITVLIGMLTGLPPGGEEAGPAGAKPGVPSAGGPDVNSAAGQQPPGPPQPPNDEETNSLYQELNTLAAGTKIPQVRNPLKGQDD